MKTRARAEGLDDASLAELATWRDGYQRSGGQEIGPGQVHTGLGQSGIVEDTMAVEVSSRPE